MRVALLSDIHGNLFALEAVLAALTQTTIDQIVCLGDVALFGPQPSEVLAKMQALACPVVIGNTDAWALEPQPLAVRDEQSVFIHAIESWGAAQLGEVERAYLRTFQPTVELTLGDGIPFLGYHGSPHSYHDLLVATTPDTDVATLLGDQQAVVLAGGHTHAQYVRRYQNKWLLNPGSVGLPYEIGADGTVRNPPWAEYALLEGTTSGVTIALCRAFYDVAPLLATAKASGMPYAELWCKDWR